MFEIKIAQKIKTHFMFNDYTPPPKKIVSFMRQCGQMW